MPRTLHDWIDAYMDYVDDTEPPKLYKMWVAASVIAACLQRKCHAVWDKLVYPNMYVVLVGPAGRCRKGTAMAPGERLLRKIGVAMAAEAITREALIRELQGSVVTYLDQDTGAPKMHCSLTVFSAELTVFLGYANQQLIIDLTDWYDCKDTWTYRTKHYGTDVVEGVYVNLIGATTPETLAAALPKESIGGGLTSRIVFVYETEKGKIIPRPTPMDINKESQLAMDLESISILEGEFKYERAALAALSEWYIKQDANPPFQDDPFMAPYGARRFTHLLKLCMVMSASRGDDMVITMSDLRRATKMLTDTEVNMPFTFRGMGESRMAKVIPRVMGVIASEGVIHFSKLMKMFNRDVMRRELMDIIMTLEAQKFCKYKMEAGKDPTITHIPEEEEEENGRVQT